MGSVSVSGWSSPESISEDLAEPGTRRFDITAGLGGTTLKHHLISNKYLLLRAFTKIFLCL